MKKIIAMMTGLMMLFTNACYAYSTMGKVFPEDLRNYDYDYSGGGGAVGSDSSSWYIWFGVLFVFAFFQFLESYHEGGIIQGIRDALLVPTGFCVLIMPAIILILLYKYGPDKWYEWLALIAFVVVAFKVGKKVLLPKK